MLERSEKREVFKNSHPLYKRMLKERGLKSFRHLSKFKFGTISDEELSELNIVDHIFATGDKLTKLSYKYYGDTRYWWVIAWFNNKPIDNLIKPGDTIHIPLPLQEILYYINRDY